MLIQLQTKICKFRPNHFIIGYSDLFHRITNQKLYNNVYTQYGEVNM